MRNLASLRRGPLSACLLLLGCSSILDIDGHYVSQQKGSGGQVHDAAPHPDAQVLETGGTEPRGTGGTASGGVEAETGGAATGGMVAAGGTVVSTSGGAPGSGGTRGAKGATCTGSDTSSDCETGLKCCGAVSSPTKACYAPGPLVGCGPAGCEHCTAPTNATAACSDGACTYACDPGYKDDKKGGCVALGAGGTDAGGASTGGHAGTSGCTKDADCRNKGCGPAGPFGCCLGRGVCGCTYFNLELGAGGAFDFGYCLPRPPGF